MTTGPHASATEASGRAFAPTKTSAPVPAVGGTTAEVAFRGVDMAFGDREVFRGLKCRFPSGQISVILGGSGSGKSTVLRLIGGLVRPQAGEILVAGADVTRLSEPEMYEVRKK